MFIHFETDFESNAHVRRLTIISPQEKYEINDADIGNKFIPGMHQKYSMSRRHNNPNCNIWTVFLTPRYSQELTAMNDQEMDEMILHDLLKIFGDVFGTLPKVKNYKMTHWDTNQFYRGSWCYWKKNDGDTPRGLDACKLVQNLANNNLLNEEPINGYNHHLLFAGDWTQSG